MRGVHGGAVPLGLMAVLGRSSHTIYVSYNDGATGQHQEGAKKNGDRKRKTTRLFLATGTAAMVLASHILYKLNIQAKKVSKTLSINDNSA